MTLPSKASRPGAHGEVQGPQLQEWLAELGEIVLDQTIADLDAHRYERMRRVPSTRRSGEATYRIRYTGPADPRAAIASVLSKLGKNFTVEELDV